MLLLSKHNVLHKILYETDQLRRDKQIRNVIWLMEQGAGTINREGDDNNDINLGAETSMYLGSSPPM